MERNPRSILNSIAYIGALTASVAGVGAGVGGAIDYMVSDDRAQDTYDMSEAGITSKDTFESYKNTTVAIEMQSIDLEGRDQTLIVRFGGACINAAVPYTKPDLANTEEDSIIDDLITSPKQPCGSEPTDVR